MPSPVPTAIAQTILSGHDDPVSAGPNGVAGRCRCGLPNTQALGTRLATRLTPPGGMVTEVGRDACRYENAAFDGGFTRTRYVPVRWARSCGRAPSGSRLGRPG